MTQIESLKEFVTDCLADFESVRSSLPNEKHNMLAMALYDGNIQSLKAVLQFIDKL